MNKKITSSLLVALMIAGSTSFSAFAAMPTGSVVIGTKAFDLTYANNSVNASDITAAIAAGGSVYVKDFNGDWIDNLTALTYLGLKSNPTSTLPQTLENLKGLRLLEVDEGVACSLLDELRAKGCRIHQGAKQ